MVDVNNFIIPEQSFRGLEKVADTYKIKNVREAEMKRQEQARKSASATFLRNYLDPKDNLTGTNYDPQIVQGFDDLLQEGIKLANEGADNNMIMMALSPKVAKLNQYSVTAKGISQRIKDQLAQIPMNSGYEKQKLEQLAKRTAFYNENGELRDIETIDPNVDYVTETIRLHPEQVTNDAALDKFIKESPKFINTKKVKTINSRGGSEMRRAKVTAPSWAIVDDEGNIVPNYEVAMENGQPHNFDFTEGGKATTSQIRLMNEKDFDSLMSNNPGIADWVRGQVVLAGGGTNLNTPQAKNAARAILYDELKRRVGGGIEVIEEQKAAPAPRITIHTGGGGNKKDDIVWDLTEYEDVPGGGKNLTVPFQGYTVTAIGGEKFLAKNVIYYPASKTFKITEYTGRDAKGEPTGETTKTVSAKTFRQNIQGMNPGTDMKPFDALVGDKTVINRKSNTGTININEVPTGTKLEKKGNDYYYKGKKVIM